MPKVLDRVQLSPDAIVFREGEPGNHAYIVQSGKVAIIKGHNSPTPITLGTIGKGGIFGEMALIDNSNRMATAVVLERAELIIVPEATLHRKLSKADPVISTLAMVMIRMIRNTANDGRLAAAVVNDLAKVAAPSGSDGGGPTNDRVS